MSLTNYSDLQTALGNWLDHSLYSARYGEFVTLFESTANRRLRVREMEALTLLYPSNPPLLTISNAANNGSGLIRLTISSTTTLATGNEVTVNSVQGTTEANNAWLVTVIDGVTVDLQGSTFTNAYTTGGTLQRIGGKATLPSDYLTWRRVTWMGQTRTELSYVHPSYFQAAYPSKPADTPRIFTIERGVIQIMPLDATALEFDYYQAIPSLVSNSTNWLMSSHPDLYLFGSMCEAEAFGVNDERIPMWKARRDEIFEEIITRDRQTRGPSYVRVFGATP
jgi:hypothetical protein